MTPPHHHDHHYCDNDRSKRLSQLAVVCVGLALQHNIRILNPPQIIVIILITGHMATAMTTATTTTIYFVVTHFSSYLYALLQCPRSPSKTSTPHKHLGLPITYKQAALGLGLPLTNIQASCTWSWSTHNIQAALALGLGLPSTHSHQPLNKPNPSTNPRFIAHRTVVFPCFSVAADVPLGLHPLH